MVLNTLRIIWFTDTSACVYNIGNSYVIVSPFYLRSKTCPPQFHSAYLSYEAALRALTGWPTMLLVSRSTLKELKQNEIFITREMVNRLSIREYVYIKT